MRINPHNLLEEYVATCKTFLKQTPWQDHIQDSKPIKSGCGIIYECVTDNPDESLAIVDMRAIPYTEPHYHPTGIIEIYFILCGSAIIHTGYHEAAIKIGDTVFIPQRKHIIQFQTINALLLSLISQHISQNTTYHSMHQIRR